MAMRQNILLIIKEVEQENVEEEGLEEKEKELLEKRDGPKDSDSDIFNMKTSERFDREAIAFRTLHILSVSQRERRPEKKKLNLLFLSLLVSLRL